MVVIGDGAVGLCATLAARRLGAGRIIALGHQPQRLTLARQFGASEVLMSSGEQVAQQVLEMTQGGAEAVLECVGTEESITMAVNICRPGGGGRVCRSAAWERTASTWTYVFCQYQRTRRTGPGPGLSSRTP